VIAKAILDMFTLLPGASRSAAQTSEQPLQAFSESLIAATRSFSQGNSAIDGSIKTGRRQRSASDDAKAPGAVFGVGAVLSLIASHQTRGANANVTPVRMSLGRLTAADERSTGFAGQFTQSQPAVELAGTESSVVRKAVVQQAGFKSRFTAVRVPLAQPATTQNASTGVASPITRDVRSAGLAETQSSIAEPSITPASISQPAVVQSNFTPMQTPFAGSATTQDTSTGVAIPITRDIRSAGLAETQSSIAEPSITPASISQPAVVQSNFTPVQMPLAGSATTQNTSTGVAKQHTQNLPAARISETESSIVPTSIPQTRIPQIAAVQSKFTAAQTPLAVPATTQNTSTGVASQPTRNVTAAGWSGIEPRNGPTNIPQTSIPHPAALQSNVTAGLQMPLAVPATTQNPSTGVNSQPTQNLRSAGSAEIQASIATASTVPTDIPESNNPKPVVLQSNVTAVQIPLAVPAMTQRASTVVASQPAQTVTAARLPETESSIAATNIVWPSADHANVAPVQIPLAAPATTHNAATVVASQPARNVTATGSAEIQSIVPQANIVSISIPQPTVLQSNFTAVETPLGLPATAQNTSIGVTSQPAQNLPVARLSETESSVGPTNIVQPFVVQSSVTPAQTPIAIPAAAQNTSTVVASQPTRNVTAASFPQSDSSNLQTSISQPAVIQSNLTAAQMPLADPTTTPNLSTGLADQSTQNLPASGLTGIQSSVRQTNFVPTSIPHPAVVQSNAAPAQTPLAIPATAQNTSTSTVVASQQPTQTVPAARLSETESIVTQVSVVPTSIPQRAVVQSNAAPAQAPLSVPAMTWNTSTGVPSQPTWNVTAARLPETESSVAPTSAPQPAVVQSNAAPAQAPLSVPATTHNAVTVVASQPAQTVTAARLPETEPGIAQTNIVQPAAVQSNVIPAQIPLAAPAASQNDSTGQAAQLTEYVPAKGLTETQYSIAHTSVAETTVAQKTIIQPSRVPSSVTPLSNDPSQSSSNLPATRIQELTAPIAASPKGANGDSIAVATTVPDAAPATDSTGVQDSLPAVDLNVISDAVQNAVANDPIKTNPVPVLRAALIASANDAAAPALRTGSTVQTDPQPPAPNQVPAAETITVPGGIADQLAALPLSAGSIETIQTSVSSLKSSSAAKPQANASAADKGSGTDQTGAKKNAEPVSEAGSRSSSQDAPSSGNQSQGGNTPQAQDAAPLPINIASHSAAATVPAPNTATVAPIHTSSTLAGAAGVAARTTDNSTAHASTALPQATPVINTAKLIQSMGQSEMRVGMRSNEFGSISISTSTTRDVVSAQISLEHGELAKTLAAHLPEIQARLGSNQSVDVRIDMNGAATGQGTGTFGGMSNSSAEQSRSGRQPAGNMAASSSDNGVAEQQFSAAAAALPTGYARLDIRV
jgi:hypothetical protein